MTQALDVLTHLMNRIEDPEAAKSYAVLCRYMFEKHSGKINLSCISLFIYDIWILQWKMF